MGSSPLSQYVITLRQRAQQRNDSMMESSVLVGENSAVFGRKLDQIPADSDEDDDTRNEDGASVFSSSWLPGDDSRADLPKAKKKKKNGLKREESVADDEDIVQDLLLSSDEDEDESDTSFEEDDNGKQLGGSRQQSKKQQLKNLSNKKVRSRPHAKSNKSKKMKRDS